jgi:hypothetical protein
MFAALFNGSGYPLLTATSPGAAAPNRRHLSVMYTLTLMCEDAGGELQLIHAKEGNFMHRQLPDGFRLIVGCGARGTDEEVCGAVLSAVSRAFTALSPCIPWSSPGMQRAAVPSEHKSIIDWLCRSIRAMLTPPGLVSLASQAPLVTLLSLKCTEFAVCKAFSAASVDCAVLQDDCICALSAGGMHDMPESDLLIVTFLACSFMPQHQVTLQSFKILVPLSSCTIQDHTAALLLAISDKYNVASQLATFTFTSLTDRLKVVTMTSAGESAHSTLCELVRVTIAPFKQASAGQSDVHWDLPAHISPLCYGCAAVSSTSRGIIFCGGKSSSWLDQEWGSESGIGETAGFLLASHCRLCRTDGTSAMSWSRKDNGCIAMWVRQHDQQLGIVSLLVRALFPMSDCVLVDTISTDAACTSRFHCKAAFLLRSSLAKQRTHAQFRPQLLCEAFPGTPFATQPCR